MTFQKRITAAAAAAAVASFAAGAAAAADVTLYGRIDTGLSISEPSRSGENGTVEMKSGIFAGSRWGLIAEEELAGGAKLRVKLENAFDSSTGVWNSTSTNRLFGRESSLSLITNWGTFAVGRIGMVTGGIGSFSSLDWYDPFETGFTDASLPGTWADIGTVDKSVVYASPTFAGFNVKLQFGFTDSTLDDSGKNIYDGRWNQNSHPWGAAFEYRGIPNLFVGWGVGGVKLGRASGNEGRSDPLLANFAVNYDFGFIKPFVAAQYSEHFTYATGNSAGELCQMDGVTAFEHDGDFKKTAYLVGITAPMGGGLLRAAAQYVDGEEQTTGDDFSKQVYAVGYTYPFSKRTLFYSALSYSKGGGLLSKSNPTATHENRTMLEIGIDHMF